MNWDAIGAVAEILGAIAVVVTLIYVAIQIRQGTKVARASAYLEYGAHISNQFHAVAYDETLTRLLLAGEAEWNQLSDVDKARLVYMWIGAFRNYETILLQVEEGLLDEDALDRLGWGEAFTPNYQLKMLWPEVSRWLSPHVKLHVETRYSQLAPISDLTKK